MDAIDILAKMSDGRIDLTSTPTFLTPSTQDKYSPLANKNHVVVIVKHIGLVDAEEMEVFVNALDGRSMSFKFLPF